MSKETKAEIDREIAESMTIDTDRINDEAMEKVRQIDKATLFKDVIHPDMGKAIKIKESTQTSPSIPLFTKELKIANLNDAQIILLPEFNDLIHQFRTMDLEIIPIILATFKETMLSGSTSKNGLLLKLMQTEYAFRNITVNQPKGRGLFRKSKDEGGELYG